MFGDWCPVGHHILGNYLVDPQKIGWRCQPQLLYTPHVNNNQQLFLFISCTDLAPVQNKFAFSMVHMFYACCIKYMRVNFLITNTLTQNQTEMLVTQRCTSIHQDPASSVHLFSVHFTQLTVFVRSPQRMWCLHWQWSLEDALIITTTKHMLPRMWSLQCQFLHQPIISKQMNIPYNNSSSAQAMFNTSVNIQVNLETIVPANNLTCA